MQRIIQCLILLVMCDYRGGKTMYDVVRQNRIFEVHYKCVLNTDIYQ